MAELDPNESVSALMQVLRERWVCTLALSDGETPYSTPLFYALAEPNSVGRHEGPLLISASAADTHHGRLAGEGPTPASAGLYLETEDIMQLRGAQLSGQWLREDRWTATGAARLREVFLGRHPEVAPVLDSGHHQLFALVVTWAKLTDNRLGMGKHWITRFDADCSEVKPSPA